MKLRKLTTAASVLIVLLAASCSKVPVAGHPKEKQSAKGPSKESVQAFLEEMVPEGLSIKRLEIDAKPAAKAGSFEVDFKAVSVAQEDFLQPAEPPESLDGKRRNWDDIADLPNFYEVQTAKGTEFTNYGKLFAEWQIDRWNYVPESFDGNVPQGQQASTLEKNGLIVGSPEAKAYFDKLAKEEREHAQAVEDTQEGIIALFSPGKKLLGEIQGKTVMPVELRIETAEAHEQDFNTGFWTFNGVMVRDGQGLPMEGAAWLDKDAIPPTVSIFWKGKLSSVSARRYQIKFAEGKLQPFQQSDGMLTLRAGD
jgi:hypothetical protein